MVFNSFDIIANSLAIVKVIFHFFTTFFPCLFLVVLDNHNHNIIQSFSTVFFSTVQFAQRPYCTFTFVFCDLLDALYGYAIFYLLVFSAKSPAQTELYRNSPDFLAMQDAAPRL